MCTGVLWLHWQFEPFLKGLCHSAPPFILSLLFGGEQRWQIALTVCPLSGFLCSSHVSGRPRNLVQWLSPVILRVLHSVALKSLIQEGKAIFKFRGLVDKFTFKMTLWKKASAVVGLSGLTPREAVRGHLHAPNFKICQIHSIRIRLDLFL